MRDEVLAPAGIGPRIEGHADRAAQVRPFIQLVADGVPGSALTVTARVAILDHEVRDDPVEAEAVEKAFARERDEVLDGERRVDDGELDLNRAAIGLDIHLRRHGRSDEPRRLIRFSRDCRRRRTDRRVDVAADPIRIELLDQAGRTDPNRPILVRQGGLKHRQRCGSAVLLKRGERSRPGRVHRVALAETVRIREGLIAARRFQLADGAGRRGTHGEIVGLQPLEEDRRRVGRLLLHQRGQHRWDDALVRVAQHLTQARQSDLGRQRAQRCRQRRAHAPVRIGIEAGQDRDEVLRIDRRRRPQRRGANDRTGIGEQVQQRIVDGAVVGRADARERADRFDAHLRIGIGGADELEQRRGRRWIADASQRANGLDEDGSIAARQQRHQHRQRRLVLQRGEAFDGEGPREWIRVFRERQQRRQRAPLLEPLKRERELPPSHARLTVRVEHRRRELRIRLQPEACRGHRRVAPCVVIFRRHLGERARLDYLTDHSPDRVGGRCVANQPQRFGRAALHHGRRVRKRRDERVAGALVAEQSEGERGHLPDFRIHFGREQRHERRHAAAEPDVADGQRRAAANARLFVAQHRGEIRRRRRGHDDDRRIPAARRRRRRRRHLRRRVAQHPLILEPENRRHLLLEGESRRSRRRGGRRCARTRRGAERDRQHQRSTRHTTAGAKLARRTVARSTRSWRIATPRPGPSGTATVPSGATSIGGSIRSGLK